MRDGEDATESARPCRLPLAYIIIQHAYTAHISAPSLTHAVADAHIAAMEIDEAVVMPSQISMDPISGWSSKVACCCCCRVCCDVVFGYIHLIHESHLRIRTNCEQFKD